MKCIFRIDLLLYDFSLCYGQPILLSCNLFAFGVKSWFEGGALNLLPLGFLEFLLILFVLFLFPSHHLTIILAISAGSVWSLHISVELFQEKVFFLFLLPSLALFCLLYPLFLILDNFLEAKVDRLMPCFFNYFL